MSDIRNSYESPFCTRYASKEMQYVFSADKKFTTWRRLWVALARGEMKLGLPVTQEQVDELEAHINDINYDVAEAREKEVRHDVMSHVYAYGVQCPKAAGIIHLGATSCYVGDNTDIIIMRDALRIVRKKIINVLANLAKFADEYKELPCLAYTHLQPAQPTTVGKRATLWMNELLMDLEEVEYRIGARKTHSRGNGIFRVRSRKRTDVLAQDRQWGSRDAFGDSADLLQIQQRSPSASELRGNGGAV